MQKKMSKDPAFLFYSSDFLTGTTFFTNEQVGKYIRLLCHQHQKGHLKEKDMLNICNSYDEDIFDKFQKDEDGLFFNVRLDEEINKRRAYSESRANNRKKKDFKQEIEITYEKDMLNTSNTYDEHMENENENENEIIIVNDNKKEIEKKEVELSEIFELFWVAYQRKGNKKISFTAFQRLKKEEMLAIKEHIPKYLNNHHKNRKMEFLPHFSTYLNQRRWEDKLPYGEEKQKVNNWGV